MKRQLTRIFVLMVIVPMLLLSACIRLPVSSSSAPPDPSISSEPASPSPSSVASPAPTDWHSGVKTDYSGLTPYKPLTEKYTRLKDGAIPDLVPSDYGRLLPYIGETMYGDNGYSVIRKFGLMTSDGMIVTDPVYARVYQGSYYNYSTYTGENVPFYSLTKLPDKIDPNKLWDNELYAVCASDGSWVTPFDYHAVFFTEKVIMLVRSHEKNDIDVMDFSGKLIYNTKSLGCYSEIPPNSDYNFLNGYGAGLIALALTGGRTVFIDALTGHETYTDYEQSNAFSGGYAAVRQNGLYGYINKDYAMIIPPQFSWADFFFNGKCVVGYPDNSYAIIDQSGNILLKNKYYIGRWDASSYSVNDADNNVVYYDSDLQKVFSGTQTITPLYGGWFFYSDNNAIAAKNSVTVFKGSEKHTFHGISGINAISGNFAAVYSNQSSSWQEGLMTLDGKVIIPMGKNQSVSVVTSEKTGETFAVASSYDINQSYTVYNASGEILFSGNGYTYFNAQYDMFEVNDELSYAYVDKTGKDIFRISLLKYLPD